MNVQDEIHTLKQEVQRIRDHLIKDRAALKPTGAIDNVIDNAITGLAELDWSDLSREAKELDEAYEASIPNDADHLVEAVADKPDVVERMIVPDDVSRALWLGGFVGANEPFFVGDLFDLVLEL